MKRNLRTVVYFLILAAFTIPRSTPAASGATEVPMRGFYEGFETGALDFPTLYVHGSGAGNGAHLGRFTLIWNWVVDLPTLTGVGTVDFTAANGDRLFTSVDDGQAYATEIPYMLRFTRTHIITGGTGRFAGARGSFHAEGFLLYETYNFLSYEGTIVFDH